MGADAVGGVSQHNVLPLNAKVQTHTSAQQDAAAKKQMLDEVPAPPTKCRQQTKVAANCFVVRQYRAPEGLYIFVLN
jgi:hypothetical protein